MFIRGSLPHDTERSEAQVLGVVRLLSHAGRGRHVLDLGCGDGRILVPLAREGHTITGIDRDADALADCRRSLDAAGANAALIESDFSKWLQTAEDANGFDAVLCLGNTFMTVADLDNALDILKNSARLLAPDGVLVLDDLPHDFWPELTEGNWQSGVSEDGRMQLIWHPDDSVFAVRRGDAVDPESWSLKPSDDQCRLWTSSALRMAARLAGLSEPQRNPDAGLLVLRRE